MAQHNVSVKSSCLTKNMILLEASAGENWVQETHREPGGCPGAPGLCFASSSHLIGENKMSRILLGCGMKGAGWKRMAQMCSVAKPIIGSQWCLNFRFGNDSLTQGQSERKQLKALPLRQPSTQAALLSPNQMESLERCQEEDFPLSDLSHHKDKDAKNFAIRRSITRPPLNQEIWLLPRPTPNFCTNAAAPIELRFQAAQELRCIAVLGQLTSKTHVCVLSI